MFSSSACKKKIGARNIAVYRALVHVLKDEISSLQLCTFSGWLCLLASQDWPSPWNSRTTWPAQTAHQCYWNKTWAARPSNASLIRKASFLASITIRDACSTKFEIERGLSFGCSSLMQWAPVLSKKNRALENFIQFCNRVMSLVWTRAHDGITNMLCTQHRTKQRNKISWSEDSEKLLFSQHFSCNEDLNSASFRETSQTNLTFQDVAASRCYDPYRPVARQNAMD